ncbi:LAFA_0E21814g1_1 [Lachancea sp. 'fantastica']|nr:LAFA_0E21814g1_1 [Lachancea sp. 'fantastica']
MTTRVETRNLVCLLVYILILVVPAQAGDTFHKRADSSGGLSLQDDATVSSESLAMSTDSSDSHPTGSTNLPTSTSPSSSFESYVDSDPNSIVISSSGGSDQKNSPSVTSSLVATTFATTSAASVTTAGSGDTGSKSSSPTGPTSTSSESSTIVPGSNTQQSSFAIHSSSAPSNFAESSSPEEKSTNADKISSSVPLQALTSTESAPGSTLKPSGSTLKPSGFDIQSGSSETTSSSLFTGTSSESPSDSPTSVNTPSQTSSSPTTSSTSTSTSRESPSDSPASASTPSQTSSSPTTSSTSTSTSSESPSDSLTSVGTPSQTSSSPTSSSTSTSTSSESPSDSPTSVNTPSQTSSSPTRFSDNTGTSTTSEVEETSSPRTGFLLTSHATASSTTDTQTLGSSSLDASFTKTTSTSTASDNVTPISEVIASLSAAQKSSSGLTSSTGSTSLAISTTETASNVGTFSSPNPSFTRSPQASSAAGNSGTDTSSVRVSDTPAEKFSPTGSSISSSTFGKESTSRGFSEVSQPSIDSPTRTPSFAYLTGSAFHESLSALHKSSAGSLDSLVTAATETFTSSDHFSAATSLSATSTSPSTEDSGVHPSYTSANEISSSSTAEAQASSVGAYPSKPTTAVEISSTGTTGSFSSVMAASSSPTFTQKPSETSDERTFTTEASPSFIASDESRTSIANTAYSSDTSSDSSPSAANSDPQLNTRVPTNPSSTAGSTESAHSMFFSQTMTSNNFRTLSSVRSDGDTRSMGVLSKTTGSSHDDKSTTVPTPSVLSPNTQSSTNVQNSYTSRVTFLSPSFSSNVLSSPLRSSFESAPLTGTPSVTSRGASRITASSTDTSTSPSNQIVSFVATSEQASYETGLQSLSASSLNAPSATIISATPSHSDEISEAFTGSHSASATPQFTSSPLLKTSVSVSSYRATQSRSLTNIFSNSQPAVGTTNAPPSGISSSVLNSLAISASKSGASISDSGFLTKSSSVGGSFVSGGIVTSAQSSGRSSLKPNYLSSLPIQSETSFLESTLPHLSSATYFTIPTAKPSSGESNSYGVLTRKSSSSASLTTPDVLASSDTRSFETASSSVATSKTYVQSERSSFQSSQKPVGMTMSRESSHFAETGTSVSSTSVSGRMSSFAQTLSESSVSSARTAASNTKIPDSAFVTSSGSQLLTKTSASAASGSLLSGVEHSTSDTSVLNASSEPSSTSKDIINSGTSNWLPTGLLTAPPYESASYQSSFDAQATATLPQVILPTAPVLEPKNYSQITVGFKRALNYPFLIENPLASAQIFSFLPGILTFPFTSWQDHHRNATTSSRLENLNMTALSKKTNEKWKHRISSRSDDQNQGSGTIIVKESRSHGNFSGAFRANFSGVAVSEIMPLIVAGDRYISSIAVVYFPTDAINVLQKMVLNNNSRIYANPDPALKSLSLLIDPTIPLTGLIDPNIPGSSGSSGGSGSSTGTGGGGTGAKTGSGKKATKSGSGALNGYNLFDVTFNKGKRLIILIPIFLFFLATWVLILFALFARLFRLTPVRQHFEQKEKEWNVDERTVQGFFMAPFSRRPSRISRDLEKYLGSHNMPGGSSSSEASEDDDLIPMSNNMVFSKSTGLYYQTDEDGNFYFAGTPAGAYAPVLNTDASGPHSQRNGDELASGSRFGGEQRSTSIAQTHQASEFDELDVDDEGNVELSVLDFERLSLDQNNTDTFESYNNENFYRLNQFLGGLSDTENAQSPTPLTTGTQEAISNSNSDSKANVLSNDSSNLMGQLSTEDQNFEEYFYSEGHGGEMDPNDVGIERHMEDGSDNSSFEGAYMENADDVEDFDMSSASPSDDDDEVNDVHVGDFDELDEVMYRRLSTASGLTGALGGSSSSNTYVSGIPRIHSASRVSSFGNTHSLSAFSGNSETGFLEGTRSAPWAGRAPDNSHQDSRGEANSVRPQRPPRPNSVISLERDDEDDEVLTHPRVASSTAMISEEHSAERKEKRNSRRAKVRLSTMEPPETTPVKVQERSKSAFASRQDKSVRASFRQSIASTLHGANIFHGSGRSRSSTVHEMGPHGHTKDALHKIQISGPISSENSLGWAEN